MTEERTRNPNIAISPSTKERLEKIGKFGETYDDIIRRLLERVAELEETVHGLQTTGIAALEAQVAALKKIAEDERAYIYSLNVIESMGVDEHMRAEARRQLAEEHPEAFR